MKIAIINGSARKGNTLTAVNTIFEAAKENNQISIIEPDKLNLKACMGCDACGCTKGCVADDDTNEVVDILVDADVIVFTSPVYWWGISGQLKLLIDKCYSKGGLLMGKKVGVVITGGSPVEEMQYQLIRDQFACIAEYLKWDILFHKSYYATGKNELADNAEAIAELKEIGASLR